MTDHDRQTSQDRAPSEQARTDSAGPAVGRKQEAAAAESLRVRSSGGAEFRVGLLRAERPDAPVALVVPAMGTRARFYTPFAHGLHRRLLHVAVSGL